MVVILRSLFIALVLISIGLGWQVYPAFKIDTDLADVTPTTLPIAGTQQATQALRANIESRVLLLLTGNEAAPLDQAEDELRQALTTLDALHVLPRNDELLSSLLEQLRPYRFALISAEQRQRLRQQSAQQIADDAYRELLGIGNVRLFEFTDDPLAWHSAALLSLLPLNNAPEEAEDYRIIGLSINRGALDMATQQVLTTALDNIVTELQSRYPVTVDRSGVFFFAAHAAASSKRDISLISTVSTLGVISLLLLAFGTLRALILPVISVLLGVSFAALVTHTVYGSIHILTIVFGASLIGIAIDYALHYMVHMRQQKAHTPASGSPLFRALLLSLTTSLIGYAALGLAGLAALQKVALFSCCGLLMAWLTVLCIGPVLGISSPKGSRRKQTLLDTFAHTLANIFSKIPAQLLLILIALIFAAALKTLSSATSFSDDPRIFFTAAPEMLNSEQRVAAVSSDFEPGRYIVISGADTTQVYTRFATFIERIESVTSFSVDDFSSIPAWLPPPHQQSADYQALAKIYRADGAAPLLLQKLQIPAATISTTQQDYLAAHDKILSPSQLAEMLKASLPPFWFTNPDGSVVCFVLIRKGLNTDQLAPITQQLAGVEYVNSLARTSAALGTQRYAALQYLAIAFSLIALLLLLRYQNWRAMGLLVVPLSAIAAFVTVCAALGIAINLFHVMALFLVLGFGMDYVIFAFEMRNQANTAQQAILLSALTSLLSFGLLSVSNIPVVSSFGLTLLIGNIINLCGAFILSQALSAKVAA